MQNLAHILLIFRIVENMVLPVEGNKEAGSTSYSHTPVEVAGQVQLNRSRFHTANANLQSPLSSFSVQLSALYLCFWRVALLTFGWGKVVVGGGDRVMGRQC